MSSEDPWGSGADWENQQDDSEIVKLGDGTGQVGEVRGLLTRISIDQYDNPMYHIQQADGTPVRLAHNTTMRGQIGATTVGEVVIVKFEGWAEPKRGGKPYKSISVTVFRGAALPAELVKAFPRWRKIAKPDAASVKGSGSSGSGFDKMPDALDSEDDDLPF